MSAREPRPACRQAIQAHREEDIDWRWARAFDLDTFEPCSYCFPDADTVAEIERPIHELIVTGKSGRTLHRHEDTGPISYDAAVSTRTDKDLNRRLPEMGPEDLGLGGDA